jgi:hypothetical protein
MYIYIYIEVFLWMLYAVFALEPPGGLLDALPG